MPSHTYFEPPSSLAANLCHFQEKESLKITHGHWALNENPGDRVKSGIPPPQQSLHIVLPAEQGEIPMSFASSCSRFLPPKPRLKSCLGRDAVHREEMRAGKVIMLDVYL